MYSTHNEGKSVVAERFIGTFKKKIRKYKLDDLVNEYNSTYHRTIKMKPIDVKNTYIDVKNTYIDFGKEVNDKKPKFKVGDHVRISKYKTYSKLV